MSVDSKTPDYSENECVAMSERQQGFKQEQGWTAQNMMPLFNNQGLTEKMIQSSFDPQQFYSRWPMTEANFYDPKWNPESLYMPFQQQQQAQQSSAAIADTETKPLSNESSSSSSGSGMYPSPDTFASTSADYQRMCYPQNFFNAYMDYPQTFPWKAMSSKGDKLRDGGKIVPTGPGTNNIRVRTADKYRMVYSDYQRLELEKEFHTAAFINSDRKTQLSTMLNLTERQIKIWFQNRRAKDRRDKQKIKMM